MIVFYLFAFVLGASLASFAGVVAMRLHVAPIATGRSKCLSCGSMLRAGDMIPIVSCLSLLARCRYCKVRFGYFHAFFEAIFGFVVILLVHKHLTSSLIDFRTVTNFLFELVVIFSLAVIFLYDLRHKIIPKYFLYAFLALSLLPLLYRWNLTHSYVDLAAPIIVAGPYLLLFLITLGRGVGFGDVLLFLGVGAMLGTDKGMLAFLLSLWIGTLTILPLLFFKKVTHKTAVPFAPFIVIGFLIVLFTGYKVSDLANVLYNLIA